MQYILLKIDWQIIPKLGTFSLTFTKRNCALAVNKTQGRRNYWKTRSVKYFFDKSETIYDRFKTNDCEK